MSFTLWTQVRAKVRELLASGGAREALSVRLLELTFSRDDRVAVDAAKLLLDAQLLGMTTRINTVDDDLTVEQMISVRNRADEIIRSFAAGDGEGSEQQNDPGVGTQDSE